MRSRSRHTGDTSATGFAFPRSPILLILKRPKNELEAMIVSQMAVTHALTMRLNWTDQIQQQDSNTNARCIGQATSWRGAAGCWRARISRRADRRLWEPSLIPGDPRLSPKTNDNPM
jgi:hypothetical protein